MCGDAVDESLEAAVDVDGEPEAAAALKRDESVEGRAQRARRIDGVLVVELVAGEDVCGDLHDGEARDLILCVYGRWGALRGCVAARVLERPLSVGAGDRLKSVRAITPDGGPSEDVGQIILGARAAGLGSLLDP
jgi:hypothetical protein